MTNFTLKDLQLYGNPDRTYPKQAYSFYDNPQLDINNFNKTHLNGNMTYDLVKYGIQYFGPLKRPFEITVYVIYFIFSKFFAAFFNKDTYIDPLLLMKLENIIQ